MFGFIDESGAPGIASHSKDCLVVSLVLFNSENAKAKAAANIDTLITKLHLPEDYEFHCSSNSTRPQTEFLKLLAHLDFRFITIAIHKNNSRKTASYMRMAKLLAAEIAQRCPEIKIEMDSNPIFHAELRKALREQNLQNVRIRERNSRSNRLIQVADYVVNISSKKVKNTLKSQEYYGYIAKKVLAFIEVAD